MSYLLEHPARVAGLAVVHLEIVAAALAAALLIALPLGIVAAKRPRRAPALLGLLGAIYTIPSLALLALLVEIVGLGPAAIFIALVAYAQFMLVRNIVTAIDGVDPAQTDAARGIGMSPRQIFLRVELPLALPVMIGGVRIAAIAMIALATLGGYIGAGGLGTLIFMGLTLHHNDEIIAGSITASLLAIGVDALIRIAQRRLTPAS